MDAFVARQPILDRSQRVFGYEILFRSGPDNVFDGLDSDSASTSVISDTMHIFGLESLAGGKRAFMNVSRNVLLSGCLTLLPRDAVVIELLETVEPDSDVVDACRALKADGYSVALDDFVFHEKFAALAPFVDIVKVDFLISDRAERKRLFDYFNPKGIRLLAEKVETRAEFDEARTVGYEFFQGYFFSRPEMLTRKSISVAQKNALQLIQQINRHDLDHSELEKTIQSDAALTVKLLRYLNSAFFGLHVPVRSVRHALQLLGEGPLKKWASLIALGTIAQGKPDELVTISLSRGRFCEVAGTQIRTSFQSDELFLMGMMSTFDAILDVPLSDVVSDISLSPPLIRAMIHGEGKPGALLALVRLLEQAKWDEADQCAGVAGFSGAEASKIYIESLRWADNVRRI